MLVQVKYSSRLYQRDQYLSFCTVGHKGTDLCNGVGDQYLWNSALSIVREPVILNREVRRIP